MPGAAPADPGLVYASKQFPFEDEIPHHVGFRVSGKRKALARVGRRRDRLARWSIWLLLMVAVVFCLPGRSAAADAGADATSRTETRLTTQQTDWRARLSQEERAWLAEHQRVRVAFDGHFPPYSYLTDSGNLEGYAVDVFALLAQRTGIEFAVHSKHTWKQLYADARNGDADVVATLVQRPARREWFLFTKPYIYKSLVIMTRRGDERIRGKQNLAGKRLAVVKDYQYVEPLLLEFPTAIPLQHDTMLDALNAVSIGRADAAVTFLGAGNHVRTKYHMSNLRFAAIYDRNSSLESIGVRKDWPLLVSILDKALASIGEDERRELERKWLPSLETLSPPRKLQLTQSEREWIKAHPVIRLGVDPEFHPFEFLDEQGKHRGYAADYVRLLNERLGLNMVVVPNLSWKQATAAARDQQIDVLPCIGVTDERKGYLTLSAPYIEFHRVIITRTDTPFLRGLPDIAGMRVAVQANSSHAGFLADHSSIQPRTYPTLQQTLLAVSNGEADALVGNIASSTYWIRRLNLTNMKVAAAASDEIQTLHFAVRNDWPVLAGILQKGLASIEAEKKQEISERWVVLKHDPKVDNSLVLKVVFGSLGVVALILLWNLQIRRGREKLSKAKDAAVDAGRRAAAANEKLEGVHEELEDLVRTRTAELVDAEKRFQQAQRMEAIGTLVSGIAHDFNNILAGMLGSIYMAQVSSDDPAVEKDLEVANNLGFRGAEMIKHLLAYARKGTGTEKSRVNVSTFMADVVAVVRTSVPSNVDLVISVEADQLCVNGNPALLEQVLLNLVNNARDAVLDTQTPRIELRVAGYHPSEEFAEAHPDMSADEYVRIEVEDNGAGIAPDSLGKIFDPFFSTKAPGKGTGLGLPMVFGAVRDHAGVIEAASALGQGSTFTVYLPISSGDGQTEQPQDGTIYRGNGETLLLADDDAAVLQAHRSIFEELGYRVLVADNGAEAIAKLEEFGSEIQLAIMDVVMPQMDGVSAARKMRRLQPELKVMFLSAHDATRDLPAHLSRSDEVMLTKPCPVPLLSRTVTQQLSGGPSAHSPRV